MCGLHVWKKPSRSSDTVADTNVSLICLPMKVIGLMSGTSADGIDAALVDIATSPLKLRLLAFDVFAYPTRLQRKLIHVATGEGSLCDVADLNVYIGELFAEAACKIAKAAGCPLSEIDLIGSHGQTLYHQPRDRALGKFRIRSTLQIGEPSVIAERTGITTVADFRTRDMAAGGEGAPLTPYLHACLWMSSSLSRAVVNIGGISNMTLLPAGVGLEAVRAFDVGPGNMLIDGLMSLLTQGRMRMDKGGQRAAKGQIHHGLLDDLMRHPFIRRSPPKSTGRETFGTDFAKKLVEQARQKRLSDMDLLATATAFTASAIANHIKRFSPRPIAEMIVCGGGTNNKTLMRHLSDTFPNVRPSDTLGYPARAIEAMTFALLAHQTWHHRPTNLPAVTGARHPVILGKIIPGRLR